MLMFDDHHPEYQPHYDATPSRRVANHTSKGSFSIMNEIIQEILKKYGEYPSNRFPHIEWLKRKLLDLDLEIDELHQDRNRLICELSKARNTINRLRVEIEF